VLRSHVEKRIDWFGVRDPVPEFDDAGWEAG
jgi:hypothetical protein